MIEDVKIFGMPPKVGRWVLVIAGMVIQLCLGATYSYGVIRGPLQAYFKSSLGLYPTAMDMTWPFIVFLLAFTLTMPIAGFCIQWIGPGKVCMAGGLLCGLGFLASSEASTPAMLITLYGFIGGLGVGLAYGCPIAAVAQWFPDWRGLVIGLIVMGFGFSAFLLNLLTPFMLAIGLSIMDILKVFGLVSLIVIVVLSALLKFPPAGWKPSGWTAAASEPGAAAKADFACSEIFGSAAFYGLWTCYTIGVLALLIAIGIVGPISKEVFANAGMDSKIANYWTVSYLMPFFALCNGLGRPLFGTLTDVLTPKKTALITYVLIIAACLLMYLSYSSVAAYIICFALLWVCLGGWMAIAPTATASYFGMKDNARNYGLVFTAYGVAAVIGGFASAQIASTTKVAASATFLDAYRPFFLVVAALAALGIVVAFLLLKPPVKKTT